MTHQGGPIPIGRAIAALEERLGMRLLVRSTRQLSPTEGGTAIYARAQRAIVEANDADLVVTVVFARVFSARWAIVLNITQ